MASDRTATSHAGITVTRDRPGSYSISGSGTFTMQDAPRVAMALEQLRQALAIEARVSKTGVPDLSKWRGAFQIEVDTDAT